MEFNVVPKIIKRELAATNRKARMALDAARDAARELVKKELSEVIQKKGSKLPSNIVASRKGEEIEIYGRGMYNVKKLEFFLHGRKSYTVYPAEAQALVFKSLRKKGFSEVKPDLKYKSTRTAGRLGKGGTGKMSRAVFTESAHHKPIPPKLPNLASQLQQVVVEVFAAHGFKIRKPKVKQE
jgi:hypothetical protein